MSSTQPQFIVFEGGEGSGKDTQIDRLKVAYAHRDDIVFTREPGGTELGERIRALLLAKRSAEVRVKAELLLFLAARAELMEEVIVPALRSGKHVISNRFGLSTIAYQIYGREHQEDLDFLRTVSTFVLGEWTPTAYILLDVSPSVGLARVASRRGEITRFDDEALAFHERVRTGYLAHVPGAAPLAHIVDANATLPDVSARVDAIISSLL